MNLLGCLVRGRVFAKLAQQQLGLIANDRQKIRVIVGHARGEALHGPCLMRLPELVLLPAPRADVTEGQHGAERHAGSLNRRVRAFHDPFPPVAPGPAARPAQRDRPPPAPAPRRPARPSEPAASRSSATGTGSSAGSPESASRSRTTFETGWSPASSSIQPVRASAARLSIRTRPSIPVTTTASATEASVVRSHASRSSSWRSMLCWFSAISIEVFGDAGANGLTIYPYGPADLARSSVARSAWAVRKTTGRW